MCRSLYQSLKINPKHRTTKFKNYQKLSPDLGIECVRTNPGENNIDKMPEYHQFNIFIKTNHHQDNMVSRISCPPSIRYFY